MNPDVSSKFGRLTDKPIYRNNFKSVEIIKHNNFEHHLIFSLQGYAVQQSIKLFKQFSQNVPIGFDMEWISAKYLKYEKYTEHVEQKDKLIPCTIQFGCENMSLVFCLYWIYKNDHTEPVLPSLIINLLNNTLICFGINRDLMVLTKSYTSANYICMLYDPLIKLEKLGCGRPNLVSMAKLLLGYESDKDIPNIDWINAPYKNLIDAGEDAILSYKIHNKIEYEYKDQSELLSHILMEYTNAENSNSRQNHIKSCKNEIIKN